MDQVGEINWSKVEHSNHYGPKQKVLHCIVRGCASLWSWRECIRFLVDVCLWIVYMELLLEHVQSWEALQGLKMVKFVCWNLSVVTGVPFYVLFPYQRTTMVGLWNWIARLFLTAFTDSVMGEPHQASGDVLFQPLYNMAFPERYFGHFPKGLLVVTSCGLSLK